MLRITGSRASLVGLFVVLVLTWFCYRPALSGAFQLDDVTNLAGLANVADTASAAHFVLSGTAGPAGRPLSLLTFALQAGQWEQGAAAFLRVNVLIHLLNALLLAACFYQLSLLRAVERDRAALFAAAAAGIWAIMPLLATASLLVAQRMTTLSALFVLLGVAGYLLARSKIEASPRRALTGMGVSVAAGTVVATLCKESGLLLPVFVLVIEATLLEQPETVARRHWRFWQALFLWLPAAVLLAYLASRAAYPDWMIAKRDFNVWERLLTESRVLWLYLQKALLGIPGRLGIYQNAPTISRSLFEASALFASVAWVAVTAAAIIWRRRLPLFAFAVLWYLGGHLLESSVLPLEVYFEYRNYLPIAGPVFALCTYLLTGDTTRRIAVVLVPAYILLSAYFLYSFASMSGEPSVASRYWALKYPTSVRAVTTMAGYQLTEEGPLRTLDTIDQFVIRQPQHAYLRIQELNLRCLNVPDQDHGLVLEQLRRELPAVDFTYTSATMLSQLFSTVIASDCNGVNLSTFAELAEALRDNPRYAINVRYQQFHHKLMAGVARQQGDYAGTIDHLEQAIALRPAPDLNMMMVTALAGAADFDGAKAFIDRAMHQSPRNPLRAVVWRGELEKLRDYVTELERYSQSQE